MGGGVATRVNLSLVLNVQHHESFYGLVSISIHDSHKVPMRWTSSCSGGLVIISSQTCEYIKS